MPFDLRTDKPDKRLRRIADALEEYAASHPTAQVTAYRQNSASIRVRVIDPEFEGKPRADREKHLWGILNGSQKTSFPRLASSYS